MGSEALSIKIKGFEKYKGREDVKVNSWFRCSNTLLDDPDFYSFEHEELLCWVYFLSLSSRKNTDLVKINFDHARIACRLSSQALFSTAKKLVELKIVEIIDINEPRNAHVTHPIRGRDDNNVGTCSTDRQTDTTLQDTTNKTNIICSEPKLVPNLPAISKKEIVSINFSETRKINITKELINSWADTYPKEYLDMEFKKARSWVLSNEHKAPKKNWGTFLNNWLNRGWEQYRKTLTSNPVKVTAEDLSEILGGLS